MNLVPYSEEFEKAVIVAVMSDPVLLPRVTQIVHGEDFFKDQHRKIFEAIESVGADHLDSLAVEDKLPEDIKGYFTDLVADQEKYLPGMSNIMYYAGVVKDKSKLRAGIELGRDIVALCYDPSAQADDTLRTLESRFADFLQKRVLENHTDSSSEAFKDFIASLGEKASDDGAVKTGYSALDLMLHRLEGLIILAARPTMGKTALAVNIIRNVAATRPVLFFSLEQPRKQIFERMLAAEAEVSLEDIRTGAFQSSQTDIMLVKDATDRLSPLFERIHVDETADVDSAYIASVARQKKYEWGDIGLIVVDYLHIMNLDKRQNKVDALGDATKEIRALGKELDCPVLLLCQLSRQPENRAEGKKINRRPELSDLRSSGEIEQNADVVIFLYRDSYYGQAGLAPNDDIVEAIIKKHRNGRQGIAELRWLPKYVKYKDI